MTDEQINIAIAKACGWDNDDIERGYTLCQFSEIVPDYCNDLNAMHEAEKIFDSALYCRYIDELCTQAIKGKNSMYLATAAQRAEAFLKTIGKWEEQN
jgi:hypothetical protein